MGEYLCIDEGLYSALGFSYYVDILGTEFHTWEFIFIHLFTQFPHHVMFTVTVCVRLGLDLGVGLGSKN